MISFPLGLIQLKHNEAETHFKPCLQSDFFGWKQQHHHMGAPQHEQKQHQRMMEEEEATEGESE